jgi:hypothetical protein
MARGSSFASPTSGARFSTWLRRAIEEVVVVDALSIYKHSTRVGKLWALRIN